MLRNFIKKMIAARTASVAMQTLNFLTDEDLKGLGYTRGSYAYMVKAQYFADIYAMKSDNVEELTFNANLVGAV
jgi:hypothetical protein